MESITDKIKTLSSLNCEDTNDVVTLIHQIATEIGRDLDDFPFTLYLKYDEIVDVIFVCSQSCDKSGHLNWYWWDEIDTIYDIEVEDLRAYRDEFIESVLEILNEKGC